MERWASNVRLLTIVFLFCLFVDVAESVSRERCKQCCEEMNEDFDGGLVNGTRPPGDLFHFRFCISRGCENPDVDCVTGYDNTHPRYNDVRGCRAGQSFLADKEVGFNPPAFLNITGSIIYRCTEDNFTVRETDTPYIDPENPDDPYNRPEGANAPTTDSSDDDDTVVDDGNHNEEYEDIKDDDEKIDTYEGEPEYSPNAVGIDSKPKPGLKILVGIVSGATILGVVVKAVLKKHEMDLNHAPSYMITPEQARHEVTPASRNIPYVASA